MSTEADVIKAWEIAAQRDTAQASIHPSGNLGAAAYEESGEVAADRIQGFTNGGVMLDYGCGDGRIMKVLQDRGVDITGYDTSPTMLKRAKERGCRLLIDYASDLPLRDYDVVYCVCVLIHHDHETGTDILRRLVDLVVPGGTVIFTLPVHDRERVRTNWTDVTVWSPRRLDGVLADLGVEIMRSPRYKERFTFKSAREDTWHVVRKM